MGGRTSFIEVINSFTDIRDFWREQRGVCEEVQGLRQMGERAMGFEAQKLWQEGNGGQSVGE